MPRVTVCEQRSKSLQDLHTPSHCTLSVISRVSQRSTRVRSASGKLPIRYLDMALTFARLRVCVLALPLRCSVPQDHDIFCFIFVLFLTVWGVKPKWDSQRHSDMEAQVRHLFEPFRAPFVLVLHQGARCSKAAHKHADQLVSNDLLQQLCAACRCMPKGPHCHLLQNL